MNLPIASRASIRYLARHPWLTLLSVVGIALGVAVVVSVDLANTSARRAFDLSAARVTGRATHHVLGPATVEGEVYRFLRVDLGVRPSAPIVEGHATRAGATYQLLGIDPFADRPFRPYVSDLSSLDLGAFLGSEPHVLVPQEMDAEPGDTLHLVVAGTSHVVRVAGVTVPQDEMSREATARLIVADVGTAQRLFDLGGRLSRIDVLLDGETEARRLHDALPEGLRLVRSSTRTESIEQMTDAFELNLSALSLLALVVAMFLIYNTITFSVVQRRPLLGRLRAVGMTKREIFRRVLLEAGLLGAVGAAVGLLLGIVLAQGLVSLVTQTINDLYYVLEVRSLAIDAVVLAKSAVLGVGAALAAAVPAAREAAAAPVNVVLQRSEEDRFVRGRQARLAVAGFAAAAAAVVVLLISGRNLTLSYVGLVLLLAAFALATPGATTLLSSVARRLLGVSFGLIGRMAARGVVHHLSRTSVAIAALGIAVAAAVGVGVMVGSFRDTVVNWLEYTLQADLYVQPAGGTSRLGDVTLDEDLVPLLRGVEGVRGVSSVRRLCLTFDTGLAELSAVEPGPSGAASLRFTGGDPVDVWRAFSEDGALLVSEPFAYRASIQRGDSLMVPTDRGPVSMPVAGVFYDYGSEAGLVMMTRQRFRSLFDVAGLSGISIYAERGADSGALERRVRARLEEGIVVRSNAGLRQASLEVFDRTFAITNVLRILALIVAFVGVVSALMALQIERAGEFGILRAEGMTPGQLRRYVALQTGLMGAIAGLLAVPLGVVLAYVLVFVINKRSFGWSLQFDVPPEIVLQALAIALSAALLAAVYPAWALSRTEPAEALRTE